MPLSPTFSAADVVCVLCSKVPKRAQESYCHLEIFCERCIRTKTPLFCLKCLIPLTADSFRINPEKQGLIDAAATKKSQRRTKSKRAQQATPGVVPVLATQSKNSSSATMGGDSDTIACPQLCGARVNVMRVDEHVKKQCPKTVKKCAACGRRVRRENVEKHKAKCRNTSVACEYAKYGCAALLSKSAMSVHMKTAVEDHLQLVRDYVDHSRVYTPRKVRQSIGERTLRERRTSDGAAAAADGTVQQQQQQQQSASGASGGRGGTAAANGAVGSTNWAEFAYSAAIGVIDTRLESFVSFASAKATDWVTPHEHASRGAGSGASYARGGLGRTASSTQIEEIVDEFDSGFIGEDEDGGGGGGGGGGTVTANARPSATDENVRRTLQSLHVPDPLIKFALELTHHEKAMVSFGALIGITVLKGPILFVARLLTLLFVIFSTYDVINSHPFFNAVLNDNTRRYGIGVWLVMVGYLFSVLL